MRSEDLRIRLRRRSEWEALDLGPAMLREWYRPIYSAWASTYGVAALVIIVGTWPWPSAAPWVLWWLKPLFDRVLLFVYGRCVFGQTPTLGDVWRALPDILWRSGLVAALTVRRLTPVRSLLLPVWQLEQQRGAAASARARLISRRPWLHAAWLTSVCSAMALGLTLSGILLFEALIPVGQEGLFAWDAWFNGALGRPALLLIVIFSAIADSVVEPFYVGSGFALYLSRRSDLEAWDVELGFRSLAARADTDAARRRAGTVAAAALLVVLAGAALAAQPEPMRSPRDAGAVAARRPRAVIREVLRDPVFGIEREAVEWRPKVEPERPAAWQMATGVWIERLAALARLAVWPVGAGLVAWLIVLALRQRPDKLAAPQPAPDVIFGVDVRPESLPDDVPGHALALIDQGRLTAALGLLYRAALSALVHRSGVRFHAGDTEGDCIRRAGPALSPPALAYFDGLIRAWQRAAYGDATPAREAALRLCEGWAVHFGEAAR